MKKIIFILFLIISFLSNSKTIFAFGISSDGKGFYSSIADSMDKMEGDLYKIDLVGKEGTKQKINSKLGNNCLKDNLSVSEIKYVSENGNIGLVINKISDSCRVDGAIPNNLVLSLIGAISELNDEYKNKAEEKTSQIFNLGSTGIYSDGIEGNAPFDLISDLHDIDSIIFMEESTVYEGNKDIDLDSVILNLSAQADKTNIVNINYYDNKINTNNNSNNQFNDLKNFSTTNSNNIYSSYLCSVDNSDSGLNDDSLNFLNTDIKLNNQVVNTTNNSNTGNLNNSGSLNKEELAKNAIANPQSNYKKVTDNSQFPCKTFFCIDIQFIAYQHNLLGGGFQDISIEYLIDRSNGHLKKFTNTSLVGSKMTVNDFELGLKDLNLADIFHIGIQVNKKPLPLLNIEKEDKKEDNPFSTENQLKFYYDSYGLEYKRRNDLSLFKKVDTDKQIALNSSLLSTQSYINRIPDYNKYEEDKIKQKEVMHKLIANETKIGIMDDFDLQFKELEIFNGGIKDYIVNLDKVVSGMLKIPNSTNE
ncbi:MAG: hypothetical protein PHH98_01080 [Candidatus Gracilibacteria bacterium]|nr:hypothetical protein [Candidatus Gracilibacteria bacterium]